eukprot:7241757-Alexandrium_andersonii.AAC.1
MNNAIGFEGMSGATQVLETSHCHASGHWKGPTGRRTRARAAQPPHVQFRPTARAAGKCCSCRA